VARVTSSTKRRFVAPEPVRHVLINFNRLSWRFGLAITGIVLLTTTMMFAYAIVLISNEISAFVDTLEPAYVDDLSKRFDDFTNRHIDLGDLGLETVLGYLLPLLLPVAAGVGVAWFVARRTAQPLERIARAANAVAAGDLEARVPLSARQLHSDDETSRLAVHFNAMAASLQHLETERRETAAAIAHELRTPLMILQARLEGLRDDVIPLSNDEASQLLAQVQTLSRLVEDLRTLSLSDAGKLELRLESLDVLDLVYLNLAAFSTRAEARGISLEFTTLETDLPMRGDPDRLSQVLANLLENALRHTPDGGRIEIIARRNETSALLEIADSGSGIPPSALSHIFERFYRADHSRNRTRGGSGLGLAIVKAIVELHGGRVEASNRTSGGASFTLQLPLEIA
jgi:two-component system, OmpR family, sensor histidine kinase BaeS